MAEQPPKPILEKPGTKFTLVRNNSHLIPADFKSWDEGQECIENIKASLELSGNLKKSIKEDILNNADRLFYLLNDYNIEKTELSREVMAIVMEKIDAGLANQKTNQDIKDLNSKFDTIITQITTQNLELKQEISELRQELKTIKEKYEPKLLEELKNHNTISKKNQQDILDLKEQIKAKPDTELEQKLLEGLKKQNEITETTQQDLRHLREEIRSKPAEITIQEIPAPRSYAEVATIETPKPTHCLLVGTENGIDTSEEVITKIKKTLNARDTGLQISKLRKVRYQRVLIGCEKQDDIDQIREKLEQHNFKVEQKQNKDPLVIIRNLSKSNTDDDILQSLEKQNSEILDHIATKDFRMKIRHRRKARNPLETHVVLEVSPQVWKALTAAGRVYVDIQSVPVFDLSPLVQCSRCLAFGHGKKWCTETIDLCSHCAGPHMRTECPSLQAGAEPACRNCLQAKYTKTDHNSFDLHCPVRKKWDALARSTTAYS